MSEKKDRQSNNEINKNEENDLNNSGASIASSKPVSKVLVKKTDEITDVLADIKENASERIVISIPSGSDLLLSTVSMKLMLRTAKKAEKNVVLVTDDPTGQRLARLAGFAVRESMNDVKEEIWERLENPQKKNISKITARQNATQKDGLEATSGESSGDKAEETKLEQEANVNMSQDLDDDRKALDTEDSDLSNDEDFVNRDFQDDFGKFEGDSTVHPSNEELLEKRKNKDKDDESESDGDLKKDQSDKSTGSTRAKLGKDLESKVSPVRKVSKGDFEMTIDNGSAPKVLDKDKPVGKVKSSKEPPKKVRKRNLVGRDFSAVDSQKRPELSKYDHLPLAKDSANSSKSSSKNRSKSKPKVTSPKGKSTKVAAVTRFIDKIKGFFSSIKLPDMKKFLSGKKIFSILVPVLILIVGIGAFMFWYLPEVFVDIEVESISVEFSGEVTASTTGEDVDDVELIIPAKKEVVTKNGSDNTDATETASRGDKASGEVLIFNELEEEVVIPSGTILSNGGLNFILQEEVTLEATSVLSPTTSATGTIVAEQNGSEYNLESGTKFSVGDYALGEVNAANSAKLTGGSSSEYTVVGQGDIDRVAEEVKKRLYSEGEEELQRKADGTRWVYVEQSLKNELEGDVKSDVPVGAEEESVNVTVNTKSTALYYDSDAMDLLIEELLLNDVDQEGDMEGLTLSEDIEKNLQVKEVRNEAGEVILSVDVKGFVMPELDENRIENSLIGRGWADGLGYLKGLDYVSGDPEIEFYPEWFPQFMRRMPSRKGQITVNVENVVPSDDSEAEDGGGDDSGEANDESEENVSE